MAGRNKEKWAALTFSILAALVLGCMSAGLSVAEESPSSAKPVATGILDAPWRFHFNLYGWLPEAPAQSM
jgi:hypothetical protein